MIAWKNEAPAGDWTQPTQTKVGSPERVDVYAARYAAGALIWHADDLKEVGDLELMKQRSEPSKYLRDTHNTPRAQVLFGMSDTALKRWAGEVWSEVARMRQVEALGTGIR